MRAPRTICGIIVAALAAIAFPAAAAATFPGHNGRIAFSANGTIYLMSPDGRHTREFAEGTDPVFAPDADRIAYVVTTDCGSRCESSRIWISKVDGTSARPVTPANFDTPSSLNFSPNGRQTRVRGRRRPAEDDRHRWDRRQAASAPTPSRRSGALARWPQDRLRRLHQRPPRLRGQAGRRTAHRKQGEAAHLGQPRQRSVLVAQRTPDPLLPWLLSAPVRPRRGSVHHPAQRLEPDQARSDARVRR